MALKVVSYNSSLFRYASYSGVPTVDTYEYGPAAGKSLTYANGTIANFILDSMTYSQNGKWMAILDTNGAILRYDTTTWSGKLIGWVSTTTNLFGETGGVNMAISNDGQYVAFDANAGTATAPKPSLRVYDALSCRDQSAYYSTSAGSNPCEYRDIWNGTFRSASYGGGLKSQLATAEYPRHFRFTGDGTILFGIIYDRAGSSYKAASYQVSDASHASPAVSLLGMGDSYISGEGAAGTYFGGTDTASNKCHLSWFSYPYRVGAQLFMHGNSVACSGAKLFDVSVAANTPSNVNEALDKYKGKDGKLWKDRGQTNKSEIIATFSPGYANQVVFASEYQPRTVLLSIGGNDIHFSQIMTSCVSSPGDACYHYYEDRQQLMWNILDQYDRLVATYKDVLAKSDGRVYVVGYPQVAKEGGSCGANVHLSAEEVTFSTQIISYLNGVIKRAAAEAGVYYVDTEDALNGYRLCEAPKNQAAVNGLTKGNDALFGLLGNESYHPTSLGHKLLAQAIITKTVNLTKPMPTPVANNKPAFNYYDALLKDAPKLNTEVRVLRWGGDKTQLLVKPQVYVLKQAGLQLKKGTHLTVLIHSTPTTVYSGTFEGEDIKITIPDDIEPGFHTIDIYGTDESGQEVDYRQAVYVASSDADYDGDGLANAIDPCVAVPQSGQDEDGDGVDDACDGDIADPSIAPEDTPVLPAVSPLSLEASEAEEDMYADSFIAPYVPPKQEDPTPPTPVTPDPESPKDEGKKDDPAQTPGDAGATEGSGSGAAEGTTVAAQTTMPVIAAGAAQSKPIVASITTQINQLDAAELSTGDSTQNQAVLSETATAAKPHKSMSPKSVGTETVGRSPAGAFALLTTGVCGIAVLALLLKRRRD